MLVKPLYMDDSNRLHHRSFVTKIGRGEINKKSYCWIQLKETIFHPKGGGQLHDEGTIGGIPVLVVYKESLDKSRIDLFEILHCFDPNLALPFHEGDEVELIVDASKRHLNSRMHTGGHLLAQVVKKLYPMLDPYHGNHDPKEGYVRFRMLADLPHTKEEILLKAKGEIESWILQNHPVSVIKLPSGMRAIEFCGLPMACGGTHVHSLKEIGKMEVHDLSINNQERTITVKYRL